MMTLDDENDKFFEDAGYGSLNPEALPKSKLAGLGESTKGLLGQSARSGRAGLEGVRPLVGAIQSSIGFAGGQYGYETPISAYRDLLNPGDGDKAPLSDYYDANVLPLGQNAVDAWTPDPGQYGSATKFIAPFFEVTGALPQIFGTPSAFITTGAADPAIEIRNAGGDTNAQLQAAGTGFVINAVGMAAPGAVGNTAVQKVLSGMGINVGLGMANNATQRQIAEDAGLLELGAMYDWSNPQAWGLDALFGAAFGFKAHLDAPVPASTKAAVATVNNTQHLNHDTLPGNPKTPAAHVDHAKAIAKSIDQLLKGEPINVQDKVNMDMFEPRDPPPPPAAGSVPVAKPGVPTKFTSENGDGEVTYNHRDDGLLERTVIYDDGETVKRYLAEDKDGNQTWVDPMDGKTALATTPLALGKSEAQGWIENDLSNYTTKPAPGPGAQAAIDNVLKAEGGYNDIPEDRGGPTNYGISQKAYPNLDIKNLTEAQAREIYKRDYWDAIGADKLPGPMQEVAFDSAVNHGVGFTKQALAEAGGDPMKLLDIREKKYDAIVKNDPTQEKFLLGWKSRLRKLERNLVKNVPGFDADPPFTIADNDPLLTNIPDGPAGRETFNIKTPEREALRDTMVEDHFRDKAPPRKLKKGQRPIAYVMGGGGASGKGTLLKRLQKEGIIPDNLVEIDPDAIKTGEHGITPIPEYKEMLLRKDSRAAAIAHEESSSVAARVRERATAEKRDFVMDRTLGDPVKAMKELKELAKTHDIHLFGVTLDPADAVMRATRRAKGAGRWVPFKNLLKAHRGFANGFEDYLPLVKKYSLHDNSIDFKEIANDTLGIVDEKMYNEFVARKAINEGANTYEEINQVASSDAGRSESVQGEAPGPNPGRDAGSDQGPNDTGIGSRSKAGLPAGDRSAETTALNPDEFPVQGAETTVSTESGDPMPVKYAVLDIGELVTSHSNDLIENPNYPQELQPRDREKAASEKQITTYANKIKPFFLAESPKAADGAPIIGQDKVVESGNARTIALRRAYDMGKATEYLEYMKANAAKFGLDPSAFDAVKRPMLVRVALSKYDRVEFAHQANKPGQATMSATEVAMADAARLPDLTTLVTSEDGMINARASDNFIRQFNSTLDTSEFGQMMTKDGELSQQGLTRIRNAVFAKAYGDPDLVAMMTEATDANVKNVLNGMLRASGEIARMRELIDQGALWGPDNTPDLVAAARKFSQLRADKTTVEQFESQMDFFGDPGLTPKARELLRVIGEKARAPKQMAEFLMNMVKDIEALGNPRQGDLLGGRPDIDGVISRASKKTDDTFTPPETLDMFVAKPVEPLPVEKNQTLFVRMGDKTFPIESIQDAAAKYDQFRAGADAGASELPAVDIVDIDGNVVANFSYNGRLWKGERGAADRVEITLNEPAPEPTAAELRKQFKAETGDDINLAGVKLAHVDVRNMQRDNGNNKTPREEYPYTPKQIAMLDKIDQLEAVVSDYLFHTTPMANLESIAKSGLVPNSKQRYEGVGNGRVSVAASEDLAGYYGGNGDVMLRVNDKFNADDLETDPLAGGQGTYTTGQTIPPDALEVKVKGQWLPLTEYMKKPSPVTTENRIAYEAIASNPGMKVMGEDGTVKTAAEYMGETEAEVKAAIETQTAIAAATDCLLRSLPK